MQDIYIYIYIYIYIKERRNKATNPTQPTSAQQARVSRVCGWVWAPKSKPIPNLSESKQSLGKSGQV